MMNELNDSTYKYVGEVLELIQFWELEFKLITIKFNIEKFDDKRSLSNMNSFLYRNKIIDEKQYISIKNIIEIRNYIIHKIYIEHNKSEDIMIYLKKAHKDINDSRDFFKCLSQ